MEDLLEKMAEAVQLDKILLALLCLLVCLIVMRIVRSVTGRVLKNSQKLDGALKGFIQTAVRILLWILTALIVADALGIPTTSLVAMFSVVGLALSLSVQNIMGNLFSGITLFISKPFGAGDFVEVAGKQGSVQSVGLFYTELATPDNMLIHIPNGDVTASTIVNYSAAPMRRLNLLFCASYADSSDAVRAALLEAVMADGRILAEPSPFVGVNGYKAGGVEYVLRAWVNNPDYWDVYFALNERVREIFRRNGITMSQDVLQVQLADKK